MSAEPLTRFKTNIEKWAAGSASSMELLSVAVETCVRSPPLKDAIYELLCQHSELREVATELMKILADSSIPGFDQMT